MLNSAHLLIERTDGTTEKYGGLKPADTENIVSIARCLIASDPLVALRELHETRRATEARNPMIGGSVAGEAESVGGGSTDPVPVAAEPAGTNPTHEAAPGKQSELSYRGEVAGGWEILSGRVQRAAQKHMEEGERVLFCLRGDLSHSLIAFEDRVLVVKRGIMAGTAFGALTATFYYPDITGIEVNTGLLTAVIEISTPSYQATARRSWVQVGSLPGSATSHRPPPRPAPGVQAARQCPPIEVPTGRSCPTRTVAGRAAPRTGPQARRAPSHSAYPASPATHPHHLRSDLSDGQVRRRSHEVGTAPAPGRRGRSRQCRRNGFQSLPSVRGFQDLNPMASADFVSPGSRGFPTGYRVTAQLAVIPTCRGVRLGLPGADTGNRPRRTQSFMGLASLAPGNARRLRSTIQSKSDRERCTRGTGGSHLLPPASCLASHGAEVIYEGSTGRADPAPTARVTRGGMRVSA
jgi:hypothetical protein